MQNQRHRFRALCLGAALVAGLAACGPTHDEDEPDVPSLSESAATAAADVQGIQTAPPPLSEGIFPCSECHTEDIPPNTKRRQLKSAHTEIVLEHDAEHRWCLDCHDANDRDHLHLAGGEKVPFEESYRLCGQCHGDKYRDWRAGVHGRRTGRWDGEKQYVLCVYCHNSHSPHFKPLKPKPAPKKPERTP